MRGLFFALWCVIIASALWVTSGRVSSFDSYERFLEVAPLSRLSTRFIDLLTLGHRGLYDDFVAIWLIQILADPRVSDVKPEELFEVVKVATRHAPKIESLYMFACLTLSFELKRPDLCEPIMLDGLNAFPNSWRIPGMQGFTSLKSLNDPQAATLYFGIAASRPGAPKFFSSTTQRLITENGLSPDLLQETLERTIQGDSEDATAGRRRFRELLNQRGQSAGERP